MKKFLISLLMCCTGCVVVAGPFDYNWYGGACMPPESVCAGNAGALGTYSCLYGGTAYYCCDYTNAELNQLSYEGNVAAQNCVVRY